MLGAVWYHMILSQFSGVARLVSWWGIARPTDCNIRVFDCSIRVYQTFWQPVGWALKQVGWACALPLPTLATPLSQLPHRLLPGSVSVNRT